MAAITGADSAFKPPKREVKVIVRVDTVGDLGPAREKERTRIRRVDTAVLKELDVYIHEIAYSTLCETWTY